MWSFEDSLDRVMLQWQYWICLFILLLIILFSPPPPPPHPSSPKPLQLAPPPPSSLTRDPRANLDFPLIQSSARTIPADPCHPGARRQSPPDHLEIVLQFTELDRRQDRQITKDLPLLVWTIPDLILLRPRPSWCVLSPHPSPPPPHPSSTLNPT